MKRSSWLGWLLAGGMLLGTEAASGPAAGAEGTKTGDYEAAGGLIENARDAKSLPAREQLLGKAKEKLAKFLAEHPQNPQTATAQARMGKLLVECGRIKVEQAAQLGKAAPQRKQMQDAARTLFREAGTAMAASEKQLAEAIKKLGFVDPKDLKRSDQRDQLRREQMQVQLARAWVAFEMAEACDPGTPEHKAALTEAAKQFRELYVKHGERLAGLYALLGQGRCQKELGETQKAWDTFEGLLAWPDEPDAFRVMKGEALTRILEIALGPAPEKSKDALKLYRKWSDAARPSDQPGEQTLAIKFLAAELALAYTRTLKEDDAEQAPLRKACLRVAREGFATAAEHPGPFQQKAKIRQLDPLIGGEEALNREPANFAEASDRAKAVLERLAASEAESKAAPADKTAAKRVSDLRDEAMKYCLLAMKLRTAEVPVEDLATVQCHIAYLHFKSGKMREAAEAGETLARHGPDGPPAREAAKIALAAYDALARTAKTDTERQKENDRLLSLADLMTGRWANYPETEEARIVLLQNALDAGRVDRAVEILQQVPASSARRGDAELCVGQALWAGYLHAARQPEGQRPSQSQLDKLVEQAQQVLGDGIQRMRQPVDAGGQVSASLAAAVLSLAQISVGAGQAEKAVQLLEDPKIGAKTLVDAQNPVARRGNFPLETYRVALRAYAAVGQLDKAQRAMQELEKLVQKDADAEAVKRLTYLYISLGRDLQHQIERLRTGGKADQLTKVLQAFEMFLTQVAQRKEGNTFHSLQWVAEAFYGLGAGFDPGGINLPPEAKKYYGKAAETYRAVLRRCEAEPRFAPQPEAAIAVQIRLARCLRRLDEHQEAFNLLHRVLKDQPELVDGQVEAAYTYQSWGDEKPDYYELAIGGSPKYREIWGWQKLADKTQNNTKYKDVFYEARYNLAMCRFRQGQGQAEAAQREKHFRMAADDILLVHQRHPDMGGRLWYDKYNELLKRIQRLRNQDPAGLPQKRS